MIKWRAVKDGDRTVVGFGLARANVERLQKGQPIQVRGEDVGLDIGVDFVIYYGETEAAMVDELRKAGVDTPLQRHDV